VEIIFPGGGDVFRHFSALLKGGIRGFVPGLRALPELSMDAHVADFWKRLQEPVFLDKDTWLLVRPTTLSLGLSRTDLKRASTLHTVLEMTAVPELVFGPEPPASSATMP